MPLRSDLRSVLVIGSGPIVIGQACEFDYSGTQACRVLRDEGIRVILVNSNPATIMTDPDIADATYVEPITTEVLTAIIDKERPDALLPTLGGQTALNAAMGLVETGVLDDYDVELIGADAAAINAGEDREEFKRIVERCGAEVARSAIARTMAECYQAVEALGGYPVVVRPSFTMGGLGSGIAYDAEDLGRICGQGLAASRTAEVLLEESILGWKEYELELMRDKADNAVVVCSIENIDPRRRPHRRFGHCRTGPDSDRPGDAAPARHRHRRHPRGRRGYGRLQYPVRRRPVDRAHHRYRDEPAGVALLCPGVQGDRFPDRQDRSPPGRGLHPRRDPQ